MTNNEIQATLKQIADVQLVHAKLLLDHERESKERMDNFESGLQSLLSAVKKHDDVMVTMQAAMERLFKSMDDFIKGFNRQNGH